MRTLFCKLSASATFLYTDIRTAFNNCHITADDLRNNIQGHLNFPIYLEKRCVFQTSIINRVDVRICPKEILF